MKYEVQENERILEKLRDVEDVLPKWRRFEYVNRVNESKRSRRGE